MGRFNKTEAETGTGTSKFSEKRKAKKAVVKAWIETKPELPTDVKEAIEYLAGMGARSQGMIIANELKNMLLAGSVSAVDIFTKFGYGAPTMNKKIRDFIKASPENRIWVAFEDGNYVLKGQGANAPEGWTGYVPVAGEDL